MDENNDPEPTNSEPSGPEPSETEPTTQDQEEDYFEFAGQQMATTPNSTFNSDSELNPAQRNALNVLGASHKDRPEFPPELAKELRSKIEQSLEPLLPIVPEEGVFVNKRALHTVFGCEGNFLAERRAPFEYSMPVARGSISHKAVELSINWPREGQRSPPTNETQESTKESEQSKREECHPLTLIDEALVLLENREDDLSDYLKELSNGEWAELRAECNDRVAKFLECFPPIKNEWKPRTESSLWLDVHNKKFTYRGKVDLALGKAKGDRAGTVIIDFKTGGIHAQHLEDLRFYALIETIRIGIPPRLVANYYLDQGKTYPENVTERVLVAATNRLIDGTTKIVELLAEKRAPVLVAGHQCRWCPALNACEVGKKYVGYDEVDKKRLGGDEDGKKHFADVEVKNFLGDNDRYEDEVSLGDNDDYEDEVSIGDDDNSVAKVKNFFGEDDDYEDEISVGSDDEDFEDEFNDDYEDDFGDNVSSVARHKDFFGGGGNVFFGNNDDSEDFAGF